MGNSKVSSTNLVGGREARGDVAFHQRVLKADIFRREGMELRRAVGERLGDRDHRRQFFVVDLDRVERRLCGSIVDGGDRRDGLAGIGDTIDRHDRVVFALAAADVGIEAGEIRADENGYDAGNLLRGRGVDAPDARVRVRAAEKLSFEHVRHAHVAGVFRASRDFFYAVDSGRGCADDFHDDLFRLFWNALQLLSTRR
jgi:hypothetical protein